jgi:hypothetical protein
MLLKLQSRLAHPSRLLASSALLPAKASKSVRTTWQQKLQSWLTANQAFLKTSPNGEVFFISIIILYRA